MRAHSGNQMWFPAAKGKINLDKVEYWSCAYCIHDDLMAQLAKVKSIKRIDDICYQSYPCKHDVETDVGTLFLDGRQIAKLQYDLQKRVDPHFREYVHD